MKNFEMIMFDLDGTLWETTDTTCEAANEVIKKYYDNYEISKETVAGGMGYTLVECAQKYMPDIKEEKRVALMREMCAHTAEKLFEKGGNLYPNLENVLTELKNKYKIAIVSNCDAGYIEAFLESSGLGKYFDDFAAAAKLQITKAEAIKRVIERNNIKSAIYVGDTIKDLEASKLAGIEFIHAMYGFGKNLDCKYHIDSISELPELLRQI